MQTVRAIETQYAGCRFRSRLEARWAVFFDQLGVPWEYEPQGFELDGRRYLPDFFLPSIDTWYEVKGKRPTHEEYLLAWDLERSTGQRVAIAWGDIPRSVDEFGRDPMQEAGLRGIDCGEYAWCICTGCGKAGIEFEGRSPRICNPEQQGKYPRNADHPRILWAFTAARSARFEHGDRPIVNMNLRPYPSTAADRNP